MAYEKQTWVNGDVITAEALNHMEQGITEASSGGTDDYLVNITYDSSQGTFIADKTIDEMNTAYEAGKSVKAVAMDGTICSCVDRNESLGGITFEFTGLGQIDNFYNNSTQTIMHIYCISISSGQGVQFVVKTTQLTFA